MVCPRCISAVTEVLRQQGVEVDEVTLGEARIRPPQPDLDRLDQALHQIGFELLYDKEQQVVEQVKALLIEYVDALKNEHQPLNTSVFLAEKTGLSYPYLSKLFSRYENLTIEKYLIRLKIERVKELLSYNELTLSEIAWELKYSSVQHLSNQFKKVTGVSVSEYKSSPEVTRTPLNEL
jgi:AraC family transcriptional regulator